MQKLLFGLLFFGCSFQALAQKEGIQYDEASKYAIEVRQRLNHFFYYMVGHIENTADSIVLLSDDHFIDEYATHWKIYAIGAAQRSAFMRDPVISAIDLRVFLNQLSTYFESGIGKDRFGPYTDLAIKCSKKLEREMKIQVMKIISDNVDMIDKTQLIELYVAGHPIQDHYFSRESTVPFFEELLKNENVKLKQLAGNISENIYDLSDRMNIYVELLPKMMRWEMELTMLQMWDHEEISSKYDESMAHLESVVKVLEDGPVWTDTLLIDAFLEVEKERILVMKEIEIQRTEIQSFVEKERELILEALAIERALIMQEAESLTHESMNAGSDHMRELTNLWFNKALILVIILVLGLLGYGWIRRSGSH